MVGSCVVAAAMACSQPSVVRTGTIPVTSRSSAALGHFGNAQALLDDLQPGAAANELSEALSLDPDFAQARALRGLATPGPAGMRDLELAYEQSARLPQAERTLLEALLADLRQPG